MKKKYSIVALLYVPLLYSINQYEITGKIGSLSTALVGGAMFGGSKKLLSTPNSNLDKLYELIVSTKTYVKEKKTTLQSVKGFFGKEDPALTIVNTLETLILDLINTIKITRGVQTVAGRAQQGNKFAEIINKANSLIPTINSLPKTEVPVVLTRMTNFIKELATTAKTETLA